MLVLNGGIINIIREWLVFWVLEFGEEVMNVFG